jgi:hypothetical protein
MKIGFTGTREGMRQVQREAVATLLAELRGTAFHHGDCIGADEQAAEIARAIGYEIHSHPPSNAAIRAFSQADVELEPKDYLVRNREIVEATQMLVAAPAGPEVQRSGTWSTVRYARRRGRQIRIVTPDGTVTGD